MSIGIRECFLRLVRLGIGCEAAPLFWGSGPLSVDDWQALENLANEQGLLGVMLDGMSKLPRDLWPAKEFYLQSIGQLVLLEQQYAVQEHAATEMALLLHRHGIRTYVLKGAVVAECYPRPKHRLSADMDCFLTAHTESSQVSDDVWERGNQVLEKQGFEVRRNFYKNSTVILPGLTVENHRYLTPFRGNRALRELEIWLQSNLKINCLEFKNSPVDDSAKFDGTWLYRPPVLVSALFLIEHAYSHFLHEGLTWRMVLDWQMFCCKHRQEIDWKELVLRVDEFGFKRFYESYHRLGQYLIGEVQEFKSLSVQDLRVLDDIWAPLDVHGTVAGLRGKLALAGNTWRARWKYRCFTDTTWVQALWNQAKGVLFENNPKI